jgi:hypothetical protein
LDRLLTAACHRLSRLLTAAALARRGEARTPHPCPPPFEPFVDGRPTHRFSRLLTAFGTNVADSLREPVGRKVVGSLREPAGTHGVSAPRSFLPNAVTMPRALSTGSVRNRGERARRHRSAAVGRRRSPTGIDSVPGDNYHFPRMPAGDEGKNGRGILWHRKSSPGERRRW